MNENAKARPSAQEKPLELTKTFDTTREVLFDYFINGDKIKQWWGPQGFSSPSFVTDPKVGGKYLGCMKSPEGKEMWSTGTFIEIKRPEQLKYTDSFADKNGKVVEATFYDMTSAFPLECVIELTFQAEESGTKLALKHFGIPESEVKECTQGWSQSLDKLKAIVEMRSDGSMKKSQGQSADRDSIRI